VVNSSLVEDPTIRLPGFDLYQLSLLNRFRTGQGHCNACHKKWVSLTTNYRYVTVVKPKQYHISKADYCAYMKQMKRLSTGWQHMAPSIRQPQQWHSTRISWQHSNALEIGWALRMPYSIKLRYYVTTAVWSGASVRWLYYTIPERSLCVVCYTWLSVIRTICCFYYANNIAIGVLMRLIHWCFYRLWIWYSRYPTSREYTWWGIGRLVLLPGR